MVDAKAAVDLAKEWTNLPAMKTASADSGQIDLTIPDRKVGEDPTTLEYQLTINSNRDTPNFIEHVEVNIEFDHLSFRDLEVQLVSPSGKVSTLSFPNDRYRGEPFTDKHRFGSAKHIGEDPAGVWTLRITDRIAEYEGLLKSWSIVARGHRGVSRQALPGNNPATGTPTIAGTARVGTTLRVDTSSIEDADGHENAPFSYQWLADDAVINGATNDTYFLGPAVEGKTIRVRVRFTDDWGYMETLTSEATAVVAPHPDQNPVPIWSATMTVGSHFDTNSLGHSYARLGYSYSNPWVGELPEDWFSLYGNGYRVEKLLLRAYGPSDDPSWGFLFVVDPEFPVDFRLKVGTVLFFASEEGTLSIIHGDSWYTWYNTTVSLSVGETVQVGLSTGNSPATGTPVINGTAQVGETITVDVSGIEDADGRTGATFSYQWLAADVEITGATDPTYTLVAADEGKIIKVGVSFTDDWGYEETLTSAAATDTDVVAETVPGTPEHLKVSPHDTGALDVSWEAPATDGGSAITEYRVQWKETAGNWDTPADVSEETATGTTHTITGLTDGVEYAVRIIAANGVGDGPSSTEATGTPRETNPPVLTGATVASVALQGLTVIVSGAVLTLTYDEALDENSVPAANAFTVTVNGATATVNDVSVSGSEVTLMLDSEITSEDTVAVSYTAPADAAAPRIQDEAGNPAASFSNQAVVNNTPAANTPSTGAPTISGTVQVGETLTADISGIDDADGLNNVSFGYQWLADDTEIAGATDPTYTLAAAHVGRTIKVRVNFTDDGNNQETLTSGATAAVASKPNSPATGALTIDGMAQVGKTLTAVTSGIADTDGLTNVSFSYQWLADDTDISSVTSDSYTPVAADEGKAIKVQVSFSDDANNQETLTSVATAAVAAAAPDPGPITGFTVVDASDQSLEGTLADGGTLALDDPDGGSFGIRADLESGAIIGSMSLELTGAKTHDQTENIAPYSLYGDSGGNLSGESLPVGEYTLTATAYSEARLGGNLLGTLKVSFTVTGPATQQTNSPATGAPTIGGTAQVGETLTVDISGIDDADGLTNVSFSYQWTANDGNIDTDISGATGDSYTLVADDEGKTIKVRVSFTDDRNFQETLTSVATAAVTAALTPLTAEFQDVPPSHNGSDTFTFRIAFSEDIGISHTTFRDNSLEVDNGSVTKAKRVNRSNKLWEITVDPDSDADVTVVLPVTEDCNATGAVCTRAEAGERRPLSNRSELTVPGPGVANSPATGAPTISGTVQVGQTLTASTSGIADADGLTNVSFSYQWLADDTDISSVTSDSYTPVAADEGKAIKVRVSFSDDDDNEETLTSVPTAAVAPKPNSPATGLPTISGTAQVGEALTASTSGIADADGLTNVSFSYQWLADDTDVSGATDDSYTLVADDEGKTVKVRVSFTDDRNFQETLTSEATAAVSVAANSPATGLPTISGTAQVGETLRADISGIGDADGLTNVSFSYQWLAGETEIAGATGGSYTLVADDEGKAIKVTVSFTDDKNHQETVASAATAAVAPRPNSHATGAPTINGTAQVGETLTASTSGIADADGLTNVSFSYQWISSDGNGDTEIQGATASTYILVAADEGKTIKVRVSFTDDANNQESLTSEPTAAVQPKPNSPATGLPTINGAAQVGETLTVDTSGIEDADGLTGVVFSYQWLADDADIAGATSGTYTLVADDVDKAIKVKVSFRDDRNHQEALTSPATAAVTAAADDSSIWSATLTVGSSAGFHGYWEDWIGSLAPDGFNIDGSDYTVMSLSRYGDLMFAFVLDQALPGGFTLQVGDTTLRSEEAEVTTSSSSYSYQWQNKIPDLSDGDIVEVSLTVSSGD